MAMAMALIWSKALLAISMGFLAIVAATDIHLQPFRVRWMLTPALVKATIRYKPFIWSFTLLALLYIVSIVYAGDIQEWWALTHMKLDFLFIPMSFALLRPFTRREYMVVTLSMVVMAFWSSIWVQVFYFQDHYLFSQSLGFGGSLPTPSPHLRYSIIIAISMILCLFFAVENYTLRFRWERWAYAFLAVYFFFFLHILSVRSGIVLGYAGIVLFVVFYFRKLALWQKTALVLLVLLAPMIAYKTLRGFEQKINYTLYDFGRLLRGEGNQYSDSERWMSWKAGMDIIREHPLFGTGSGHFRPAIAEYYKTHYQREDWMRPENQFLLITTVFGLLGLIVLLFVLIYPMLFRFFWSPPLMPILYLMQLISMLPEHPLDTAVGTSLFLLITMTGLSYQDGLAGGMTKK